MSEKEFLKKLLKIKKLSERDYKIIINMIEKIREIELQ